MTLFAVGTIVGGVTFIAGWIVGVGVGRRMEADYQARTAFRENREHNG